MILASIVTVVDWEKESNRMLISVQVRISCMSMCGHWQTLCVESRIVISICTSCNETREDSCTRSRLVCTNPSWAICSLACGTRVLTRASNKIKQHTRENYTNCKLGHELYRAYIHSTNLSVLLYLSLNKFVTRESVGT